MKIPRPESVDEYLDLVDQAIFEMEDVLACAEYEDDDIELSELTPLYEYLVKELKLLHAKLLSGNHGFGQGEALAFAEPVAKWGRRIPCLDILNILVRSYKEGLE